MSAPRDPKPYADPYLAGVGLGLVLLASYVLAGQGLGASGAFTSAAAKMTASVDAGLASQNRLFSRALNGGNWMLLEIGGVIIGGFLSALLAGRVRREIERGPRIGGRSRLLFAVAGGILMGFGAVLARGCTSGLALSGGALLAAGSWVFIGAAFAAGYAAAPLLRRVWR
jgi:uncharacterized membrane protein YedE/YeeE